MLCEMVILLSRHLSGFFSRRAASSCHGQRCKQVCEPFTWSNQMAQPCAASSVWPKMLTYASGASLLEATSGSKAGSTSVIVDTTLGHLRWRASLSRTACTSAESDVSASKARHLSMFCRYEIAFDALGPCFSLCSLIVFRKRLLFSSLA